MTKRIFLLSVFLLLTAAPSWAYEHPRYQIDVTVDPAAKKLAASQTVTFTNNTDTATDRLYFHIYPNRLYTEKEKAFYSTYAAYFKVNPFPEGFQETNFHVGPVSSEGGELSYIVEGDDRTLLRVDLPQALAPGESVTVRLEFGFDIPHAYGRLGWHDDVFALSRFYPILSVYDENGWNLNPFYPFHRPFFSEAAHYEVAVNVPEEYVVIHSGVEVSTTRTGGNTKNILAESEYPIREFTMALSTRYRIDEKMHGDIRIKTFYLPGKDKYVNETFKSARDMMAFYEEKFGEYPYSEFSIAPVYLGYGGEQMSNMIFIDTRVFELPTFLERYFDFLIAHETGHQWIYNMIGVNGFTQTWIEEGIHSHFLLEHLQEKYGEDAAVVKFPKWARPLEYVLPNLTFQRARGVRYKMLVRQGWDHPTVDELSSFQEPSTIFSIAYGKGSRIAAMLKHVIGEEAFARSFKRVYRDYRFRNLDIDELISIVEEESGRDLSWFFDQWLYSEDYFDAAVTGVSGNVISIRNKGGIVMPVTAKVVLKNGEERTLTYDERKISGQIAVDSAWPVQSVELDPDKELLDVDRTNNTWPRRINIMPVPLYTPLHDVPALVPDDGYNLVFGPETANSGIGFKASFQKPYDQIVYAATDYEIGEDLLHSRFGYELRNLLGTQLTFGAEIRDRNDTDDGSEDLTSGKVFLRKELWPVQYGLGAINDHVSLYVVRNQGLDGTLLTGGEEDDRNLSYLERNEAIVGVNMTLNRSRPYPDPNQGYKVSTVLEHSGHFLEATQSFTRSSIDASVYQPVTAGSQLALRMKYGWGGPNDKMLYELGGPEGLRGFDRKTVRGANVYLGSVEYRFPILKDIHLKLFDNLISLESVQGVAFFDAGQAWFSDFGESEIKKDAGAGLRFHMNIGSYLEKVIFRVDAGQPIDADDDDLQVWFGLNHAF